MDTTEPNMEKIQVNFSRFLVFLFQISQMSHILLVQDLVMVATAPSVEDIQVLFFVRLRLRLNYNIYITKTVFFYSFTETHN